MAEADWNDPGASALAMLVPGGPAVLINRSYEAVGFHLPGRAPATAGARSTAFVT